MRRTQTFTIQNTTEVTISFTYKWHENGNWVPGHVPPNATGFYAQYSSNVSTDYPKISYTENVTDELQKLSNFVDIGDDNEVERDDDRSTEKVQKLETQTGYSGRNTKFTEDTNQSIPRGYNFQYDKKTKKISLHEGLLTITKPTKRSFPIVTVVLISVLVLEIIVIVFLLFSTYFPKRPILIIHNNTKSDIGFQFKWTEEDDWDIVEPIAPDSFTIEWYVASPKKIPQDYPKVRFESIVNDKRETIEQTLGFDVRRFWHKSEPKTESASNRHYHFEFNPETEVISLADSESSVE